MDRVPTGIKGFDNLIEGGFPKGSSVLLSGSPGVGKSIFCVEYLYNGALKHNEKGLYVTFEQKGEELINQGSQFGWNIKEQIDKGMMHILSIPAKEIDNETTNKIVNKCTHEGIKRLVIDSLSTLSINAPIFSTVKEQTIKDVVGDNVFFSPPIIGDLVVKRFIYSFIDDLKRITDTSSILISETSGDDKYLSRDTISEFLADGVIMITFESMGGTYSRSLMVRKMRQTKNNDDLHPLEISKSGLVVHKIE